MLSVGVSDANLAPPPDRRIPAARALAVPVAPRGVSAEPATSPRIRVESDPILTRAELRAYHLLIAVWTAANIGFWLWWLQPDRVGAVWMYWILTIALAYDATFLPSMCLVYVGRMRQPRALRAAPGLRVALITPCVPGTESFDIILRQLGALARVEYPHDSWILDEGNDPAIRAAAQQFGVRYFSRAGIERYNQKNPPFKERTKAGNINAWLDEYGDQYDYFVQLDIDHVPEPDYLDRTLGFFRDPVVAWVQAPSVYSNLDNWNSRGLSEQDGIFNGVLQHGFFGACETPFIVGSHCTYRTSAVMRIGGFQPTRAEDHLDTVTLAAHGYRGIYLPKVLARGLGPDTFETYLRQQFAWSTSMTQILFHHLPKLVPHLRPSQLVQFLFAQTWYSLHATTMLVLFALPGVSLLLGQQPAHAVFGDYVVAATPLVLGAYAIGRWTRRWHQPTGIGLSWRGVILHVARWPIAFWALVNVVLHIQHPYMVTPKGETGRLPSFPMRTQFIFLGAAWLCLGCVWQYLVRAPLDDVQGQMVFALLGAACMIAVVLANLIMHVSGLQQQGISVLRIVGTRLVPILTVLATLLLIGFTGALASDSIVKAATWRGVPATSQEPGEVAPNVRELLLAPTPTPLPNPVDTPQVEPQLAFAVPLDPTQAPAEPTTVPIPTPPARLVIAALPLATDRLNVGAYDPQQQLASSVLDIDHWYIRQDEPELLAGALAHARNRRTPLITIEPYPAVGQHTPVLDSIVAGDADDDLKQLAAVVHDSAPQIVLLRWGHEMDLSGLYPWSSNDPVMYRAAFRHVVAVFADQGVANVRWVWSPAGESNALGFYPGADVVDYVGLTVLGDAGWDASFGLPRQSMEDLLASRYAVVQSLATPVLVTELGVSGTADEQKEWLTAGAQALPRFPLVRGVVYFDDWNAPNNRRLPEPDWTLGNSNTLLEAFAMASPGSARTSSD